MEKLVRRSESSERLQDKEAWKTRCSMKGKLKKERKGKKKGKKGRWEEKERNKKEKKKKRKVGG